MPPRRPAPSALGPRPASPPARPAISPPTLPLATGGRASAATPATGATGATPVATTVTPVVAAAPSSARTARRPRRPRIPASPVCPPATHYGLGTWLMAMSIVMLLGAVAILGALLYVVPQMIDSGNTTAVSAPITSGPVAPAPASSTPTRPVPQFKAVERAPKGNTFDEAKCLEWYDGQGFLALADEFWNVGAGTCR